MKKRPIALLDANILYSAQLRDIFVQLAYGDSYPMRWTDDIHEEWMHAVLRKNADIKPESLARARAKMDGEVPQAIITGYEYIIPTLELPDPDDRHVLAAAIKGKCDLIITLNLADFPNDVLAQYGIEAQNPDNFLCHLLNEIPDDVCGAIRTIRARLKNPYYSVDEYLDILEGQSLPKTVAVLRKMDEAML